MKNVWILARNSWQENVRGKFFGLSLVFAGVILYVSILLGALAAEQETRVLYDFGLSFIEMMTLAGVLYGSTTVIMREMESKTIYMILTRPVTRGQYLMGRFLGLALSAAAAMAAMAIFHLGLLFLKGWRFEPLYLLSLTGSYMKVLVTAALAIALTLFSSSVLTGLSITLILWTLGHFLPELRYMIAWGSQWAITPLRALSFVIPDFQLLNYRDQLAAGLAHRPPVWLALVYAPVYAGIWLLVARALLKKKGVLMRELALGVAACCALNMGLRPMLPPPVTSAIGMRLHADSAVEDAALLGLGMRRLAADLGLIRLLLYYGAPEEQGVALEAPGSHPYTGRENVQNSWGGGSYRELGPSAERVLDIDPSFTYVALYAAGSLAFNLNRPGEALDVLRYALKRDPGNVELDAYVAAIGFQVHGDPADVIRLLEPTLSKPDCPTMIKSMVAFLLLKQGRRAEAARLYEEIVENSRDPGYVSTAKRMLAGIGGAPPR